VRVVSLLPGATEMVTALGGADQLVAISHECDYPPSITALPRVTASAIDPEASSAGIDAEVSRARAEGRPVIAVDADLLARLAPDLIITQDLCEVCAVADGQVYRLATALDTPPAVLSLQGRNLPGIWEDIHRVGRALDLESEADELVSGLKSRVRKLLANAPDERPRVVCLEWLDPLYFAGHWVPEMVAAAGGDDVGAVPGSHSSSHSWDELRRLRPDVVMVMLCGFGVARAVAELGALPSPQLEELKDARVWVLDGNAYTSRPGPRVVDGIERIRSALDEREMAGVIRWIAPMSSVESGV
jgi:iron complex transport system substrate-binding protein